MLNTDRLGGQNCHVNLDPLELGIGNRYAAIVTDRRIEKPPCVAKIPALDLVHAAMSDERYASIKRD